MIQCAFFFIILEKLTLISIFWTYSPFFKEVFYFVESIIRFGFRFSEEIGLFCDVLPILSAENFSRSVYLMF